MSRRRARRTAHYQALGEDFLRRMDVRTEARCAAIKACHDGPDAMRALLDDLGERIAAERARHGIPADRRRTRTVRSLAWLAEEYGGWGHPPATSVVVGGRTLTRLDGEDAWTWGARAVCGGFPS